MNHALRNRRKKKKINKSHRHRFKRLNFKLKKVSKHAMLCSEKLKSIDWTSLFKPIIGAGCVSASVLLEISKESRGENL
jgi:hypothetical protein